MSTKRFLPLLQTIANNANTGTKPVTVQTGIMKDSDTQLDQQLTVTPTLPKIFTEGIKVKVDGVLNGKAVTGELTLVQELNTGDKVKIIKEDGTTKYFVLDAL